MIQINKTKSEDAHKNALGIEGECCGFKTDTSDKTGNLINNLNYIDNENNMIIMRYKPLDGKDKYIRRAISFDENGNIIKPQRKK